MIIVRIKCGLGNQLFQYAAGYALSKRLKQPFLLYFGFPDRSFRLNQLNIFVKTLIPEEDLPHEFTMMKIKQYREDLLRQFQPSDDPMQRKPVIDLARKEFNWEPKIQLRESLIRTIEYFRKIL